MGPERMVTIDAERLSLRGRLQCCIAAGNCAGAS